MMGHRYSLNFIIYSKYFSIDIKYYYNLKKICSCGNKWVLSP